MAERPRRRRKERGEQMTIYLPTPLATKLRVKCAKERMSLSGAVEQAIEAWLKRTEK